MPVDMKELVQAIRSHSGMKLDEIREVGQEYRGDAGWPGFSEKSDCAAFYDQNRENVWELLTDRAYDTGMSPLELLASLNRAREVMTHNCLMTVLAWFTLEEAGRWLRENSGRRRRRYPVRLSACGTKVVERHGPSDYRVVCAACGAGGSVHHRTRESAMREAVHDSARSCQVCGVS